MNLITHHQNHQPQTTTMPPLSTQTINSTHAVTLHTTPRNIFVALDDGTGGERGGVCAVDTWFEEGREEEEWVAVGGTDCLVGVWWVGSLCALWDLVTKKCLHVLGEHTEKLYAVKFDGERIATGSLDRSVRVWDPISGTCQAVLGGHGSLVGVLEFTGESLVTACSGGRIFSWSLDDYTEVWRVDAHANAVTTPQSDGTVIVSGGSDGKVWNARTGVLISELLDSDAVWQVSILDQKILVFFMRNNSIVMESKPAEPLVAIRSHLASCQLTIYVLVPFLCLISESKRPATDENMIWIRSSRMRHSN
ncbi:WD40-repeat-containing domain protein [Leptodontidium sp. 2 PMI_412]|nr:WD40-repeat-containing domain protein [Leptodontidium sp. 2 PMI_412]